MEEVKLIDANRVDFSDIECCGWIDDIPVEFMRKYLQNQPSIDAVPVIRCKDCKHFYANKKNYLHFGTCECPGTPYGTHPTPNFYCACGERMEREANTDA